MKRKNKINETIMLSAISPISFIALIDSANVIEKNKNLIQFMFPNESMDGIKSWFYKFGKSDVYKESSEKLQSIGSRFSTNPILKVLYKSLDTLKSATYNESEKESHEADIRKIIEKIGLFIKKRLTEDDIAVLESILPELNGVSEKISKKIDNQIDGMVDTEKKTEVVVNERLRNKFRKKIKEIIRTHLFSVKNL